MWAKPSGLAFQIKEFGPGTNIAIDYTWIDGRGKSVGLGMSPTYGPPGYSFLHIDRDEPWKLDEDSEDSGKENNKYFFY